MARISLNRGSDRSAFRCHLRQHFPVLGLGVHRFYRDA
jgi:hypothetical protein